MCDTIFSGQLKIVVLVRGTSYQDLGKDLGQYLGSVPCWYVGSLRPWVQVYFMLCFFFCTQEQMCTCEGTHLHEPTWKQPAKSTYCGLGMPYHQIDLYQHWFG